MFSKSSDATDVEDACTDAKAAIDDATAGLVEEIRGLKVDALKWISALLTMQTIAIAGLVAMAIVFQ